MGVQISDIPKVAFSQNEIAVTLTSDDYLESVGVAAVYLLDWSLPVSDGDVLHMWIGGKVGVELYAVDNPDDSGDEIPEQGAMTMEEYIPVLIEALNSNYELYSRYFITPGDNFDIKLTA